MPGRLPETHEECLNFLCKALLDTQKRGIWELAESAEIHESIEVFTRPMEERTLEMQRVAFLRIVSAIREANKRGAWNFKQASALQASISLFETHEAAKDEQQEKIGVPSESWEADFSELNKILPEDDSETSEE